MPKELLDAIAEAKEGKSRKPVAAAPEQAPRAKTVFEGRGRNSLHFTAANEAAAPVSVSLKAGDVFENGNSSVVLLKSFATEIPPGGTVAEDLTVAAISSADQEFDGIFQNSTKTQPKLESLLRHLESHPALPINVVQTAVLAIVADAPVDLFARFPRLHVEPDFAVEGFRVDTFEIVAAIQLLRDIGVESCQLSADPQLKIEAMLDLRAHEAAMKYYGIDSESEWLYWKHELLEGDPSTRHYALYGIARFYPDVALQMMPKWARERRTAAVYRRAAIGALALTLKPEAAPILRELEPELAGEKELAQSAGYALRYLEENIDHAL